MKNALRRFWIGYFDQALDLRVRLFNVLAMAGTIVSLIIACLGIFNNSGIINVIINFAAAVLSFVLLTYSRKTGKYQLCYMITIFAIFIILFPVLFFSAGAYYSGMPSFFVFAVAFTIFMLEGKSAILFSVFEIAVYVASCLIAYHYPQMVNWYDTEQAVMTDVIIGFVSVSVALGISMFMHFRIYNRQQQQLAEQNQLLERAGRQKSALLADVSHEIRTPLTVMSGYAQRARRQITNETVNEETLQGLLTIQLEAQRLAELAEQLIYAPIIQQNATLPEAVSISDVVEQVTAVVKPIFDKNGNHMELRQIKTCPPVHANAAMISQVLINLCLNANRHTANGEIVIAAKQKSESMMEITVTDNGDGIAPDLLPHIFERGVSGDNKSGLGLSICKEVVEGHGGEISIIPLSGAGTCVAFTLPLEPAAKEVM